MELVMDINDQSSVVHEHVRSVMDILGYAKSKEPSVFFRTSLSAVSYPESIKVLVADKSITVTMGNEDLCVDSAITTTFTEGITTFGVHHILTAMEEAGAVTLFNITYAGYYRKALTDPKYKDAMELQLDDVLFDVVKALYPHVYKTDIDHGVLISTAMYLYLMSHLSPEMALPEWLTRGKYTALLRTMVTMIRATMVDYIEAVGIKPIRLILHRPSTGPKVDQILSTLNYSAKEIF